MPNRLPLTRRWLTAASWPIGVTLTSWDYVWRTTPMHRRESSRADPNHPPISLPTYPADVSAELVQTVDDGVGPLFHRRYRTRIRNTELEPSELIERLRTDLNQAAPTKFARFQLVEGAEGRFEVGDEYVVRMPGPWDGPVRVIEVRPRSFRLATLAGHLEAGQIEFRAALGESGERVFEIESWARSSSRFVNLLYHHLRMAKEVQAHMWISFLERVVKLAGGRMSGGIELYTEIEPEQPRR